MSGCDGGDQLSEEYAPHLYYKGKFVGEEEAKRLKERDEQMQQRENKERLKALKKEAGAENYNFSGYEIDPLSKEVRKNSFLLGRLQSGYIELTYLPYGSTPVKSLADMYNQWAYAKELAEDLQQSAVEIIEIPPRAVLKEKLEHLVSLWE
ncbi:MAG: hypothetical protein AABX04_04340 [Nanoarchaeota archaeon]